MSYQVETVSSRNKRQLAKVVALLEAEQISLDGNLDYTCVIRDDDENIIATGSAFGNTLRCLAVSKAHQGEGLLNLIISHLVQHQFSRGNSHLFVYTKVETSRFFQDLGFYELATVSDKLVFMENKKTGFADFLQTLSQDGSKTGEKVGGLVMNANPFTKGHLYLVEKAAKECDLLHLFVVSEDVSFVPFSVRKALIQEGTAHLDNIIFHNTGDYIISNATFPSYFLKDEGIVMESHARLDLSIFTQIAQHLGIQIRYVGEEPTSAVTGLYNKVMVEELEQQGISCVVVPRKEESNLVISASTVRQALKEGDWDRVESMVPPCTLGFFKSQEGAEIIKTLQEAESVIHH